MAVSVVAVPIQTSKRLGKANQTILMATRITDVASVAMVFVTWGHGK